MTDVMFSIEYRPRNLGGQPEPRWISATNLDPETREDAERLVDACRRAMPMREYRILEIKILEIKDEDIPF